MIDAVSPTGPCFAVGPKGYLSFQPRISSVEEATLHAARGGFFEQRRVYDATGRLWRAKRIETPRRNLWRAMLSALGVSDPIVTVTVFWQEPVAYALQDLKTAYSNSVDQDDDTLTQFVEAAELKKRIADARSFADLVRVYEWMETDPD